MSWCRIHRMHQVGLIDKWLRDYLPKKDRCWSSSSLLEANNHSVNLGDMQGSFFVLFLGQCGDGRDSYQTY